MDEGQQHLEKGALGLAESLVMGVAGTAPAYSLAATVTTLTAAVGMMAAPSLLYSGLIMFGITLSFIHLTRVNASAGASFTWVSAYVHPLLGFLCGWTLMVASAVFMVAGSLPAATATLAGLAPAHLQSPVWVTAVAAAWLLLVGVVVLKGIKATSYTQVTFTVIEVGSLLAILIAAWRQPAVVPGHVFSWAVFAPSSFHAGQFVSGALIALFFFWGWDVTLNLNEETEAAETSAGKALFFAMLITLLLYVGFTAACQHVLSDAELQAAGTNVVYVMATHLFPAPWSYFALLAVTLSTVGNLETSILQFTRTLFAKSRSGVLPARYALLHRQWRTPWLATVLIVALGLVFLALAASFPSVNLIVKDSVDAIGFQVCFYYSLTAWACVHRFWGQVQGLRAILLTLVWPAASGLFLVYIGVTQLPQFDRVTTVLALGGILVGLLPWWWYRRAAAARG